MSIPDGYERLLTRGELAKALTDAGFKTSVPTLATFACRRCGPEYRTYGRTPLYSLETALDWARARLAAPRRSAFDADTIGRTVIR